MKQLRSFETLLRVLQAHRSMSLQILRPQAEQIPRRVKYTSLILMLRNVTSSEATTVFRNVTQGVTSAQAEQIPRRVKYTSLILMRIPMSN